jgi:hypothetical protein
VQNREAGDLVSDVSSALPCLALPACMCRTGRLATW